MIDPVNPDRHQFDRDTQLLPGQSRLSLALPLGAVGLWLRSWPGAGGCSGTADGPIALRRGHGFG